MRLNSIFFKINKPLVTGSPVGLFLLIIFASIDAATAQKLTDPAMNFTLFIKNDVTLVGTEIEGRVAAGGNLNVGQNTYQIAPKTNDGFKIGGIPIGLAVRGGLVLHPNTNLKVDLKNYVKIGNGSSPNQLEVKYTAGDFSVKYKSGSSGKITINANPSDFGTPAVSASNNPVIENVFGSGLGKIDIDRAFQTFEAISASLGSLANTVTIKNFDNAGAPPVSPPYDNVSKFQNMKPKVILASDRRNVLNITADVLNSFSNGLYFEGFSSHENFELIINVLNANGKTINFPNSPELQNNKGRVLFNFPNTDQSFVIRPRAQLNGVFLAPRAEVAKQQGANIDGQIIARAFTHDGDEIHYYPYLPKKVCDGETLISGQVFNQTTPLPHVPLLLVPLFEGGDTLLTFTNYNGEYRFTGVPEGNYNVRVQDQNLILTKQLFPVASNSEDVAVLTCKPVQLNFTYERTLRPAVGDLVWLDINKDNEQNEWFDANGDDQVTQNKIDIEGFEAIPYRDWEWVDLNGNGRWNGPEDEGELNRAGVAGHAAHTNIVVTGPSGYNKRVKIGPDGYWRDNPGVGMPGSESNLFGEFTARLEIDEMLAQNALKLASTGRVKVFDGQGRAVKGSWGTRSLRQVVSAPFGVNRSGLVTQSSPVNETLDMGLSIEDEDTPMPVTLVSFEASWNSSENQSELKWTTVEEVNSDGFEILYSVNGTDWKSVGFVASKEVDAGSDYRFQHRVTRSGIAYYRLKMLDRDATFEYSPIVSVVVNSAARAMVYPNPTVDYIRIDASEELKEAVVIDAVGNVVRRVDKQASLVDVSALSSGLYYLRIVYQDGGSETMKVLKK